MHKQQREKHKQQENQLQEQEQQENMKISVGISSCFLVKIFSFFRFSLISSVYLSSLLILLN